jgi:hypothetical protein
VHALIPAGMGSPVFWCDCLDHAVTKLETQTNARGVGRERAVYAELGARAV